MRLAKDEIVRSKDEIVRSKDEIVRSKDEHPLESSRQGIHTICFCTRRAVSKNQVTQITPLSDSAMVQGYSLLESDRNMNAY